MTDYELISHTADIGIRVKGKNFKALFVNAAQTMFDVVAETKTIPKSAKKEKFTVSVTATGREELFVRWLSELISLSDAKDVHFTEFDIKDFKEQALSAGVVGFARRYFDGKREIKAVTYHALKIEKVGEGYQAEVIFDV